MLKVFDSICRKYNLLYWCSGGTLIGALRHKGFIPWDADLDVCMLRDDYNKLKKIVQKELPKTMWFQDKSVDKYYTSDIGKIRDIYSDYADYKPETWHNGLQLDIFIFTKKNDTVVPYKQFNDLKIRKYDFIFPLKEEKFEGFNVYIPNQFMKYSINSWGAYPPPMLPIRQRYPHEGRLNPFFPAPFVYKKYPELYMKTIITFGTFDLLHTSNLNILKNCKKYGNKLIVGVSTDKLILEKKNKLPTNDQNSRKKMIENLNFVDEVFFEESLEKKKEYILKYKADILISGDDWKGKFDFCKDICEVVYLPYTL